MPRSLAALLVFTLVLLAGFVREARCEERPAAATTCVACKGTQRAPCPTCSGKGRRAVECDVCDGKGRLPCATKSETHSGTQIDCPNRICIEGTITWTDAKKSTCKLCSGAGSAKCMDCVLAASPCGVCSGKGAIDVLCGDCAGKGQFACAACAERSPRCVQCDGKKAPCPRCRATGTQSDPCGDCAGRGVACCPRCDGVGRVMCPDCEATGRYRAEYDDGTSAASMRCRTCEGRGVAACGHCKGGRSACTKCRGTKRVEQECETCDGGLQLDCRSCGDWFPRAAQIQADRLMTASATAEETRTVIRMLKAAVARATELERAASAEIERLTKEIPQLPAAERSLAARRKAQASVRRSWLASVADGCAGKLAIAEGTALPVK